MPADKPTELWSIKLKNLNSIAHPYDQRAFSPLNLLLVGFLTWLWWYTCLLLLTLMLWHRQVIFKMERRQAVFLCWMQDIAPKWKALPWVHRSSPHRPPESGKLIPMPSSHHRSATPRIYMATAIYQPQGPDVVTLAESQIQASRMRVSKHSGLRGPLKPGPNSI